MQHCCPKQKCRVLIPGASFGGKFCTFSEMGNTLEVAGCPGGESYARPSVFIRQHIKSLVLLKKLGLILLYPISSKITYQVAGLYGDFQATIIILQP